MKKTTAFGYNMATILLLIMLSPRVMAQPSTEVAITGIRAAKGNIVLNVFKDNASYNEEKPFKKLVFDKKALANGNLSVRFDIEPGVYGITLLDDENGNGRIDKNFIRMPKEGFGFSNFFMEKLKKPAFDDFKVDLKTEHKINIKIRYM